MQNEKSVTWIIRLLLVLLIFLSGYIFLKLKPIWSVLLNVLSFIAVPVLISAFITYLLHPLIEKIQRYDVPRWLAISFIYVLFFGGIGVVVVNGLPRFLIQLQDLADNAPEMFLAFEEMGVQVTREMYSLPEIFHDRIEALLTEIEMYVDNLLEKAIDTVKSLVNSFFVLIVIPFLVFYFLKDLQQIKTACWYITPKKWRTHCKLLIKKIDHSLGQYIRGQLFVIGVLSTLATTAFWLLDLPYPILLGTIVGITEIIPYFGPIIGAIPAVFVALTFSPNMVWWVIGIMLVLQLIEGSVLSPLIVGKSLRMHPIVIIIALLIGGELAGVVGMLLAVPLFAIARVVISHFHGYLAKH